ncbi:MAG: hypothetical protein K6G70_03605 [Bacteroidaceae bacterium]|nr:hypothetical protein [Bacteroidaceae bacterium]
MKKLLVTACVIASFFFGFTASDDKQDYSASVSVANNTESLDDSSESTKEKIRDDNEFVSQKDISQIEDIEELRQAINNTVWTHTIKGDAWLRYEFIGNIVKQYGALPRSGEWRYDGDSQFELSERRSESDGKRYIIATFMPKTESLAVFELPVVFNYRDYHLYLNGQDIGGFIMADYEWD